MLTLSQRRGDVEPEPEGQLTRDGSSSPPAPGRPAPWVAGGHAGTWKERQLEVPTAALRGPPRWAQGATPFCLLLCLFLYFETVTGDGAPGARGWSSHLRLGRVLTHSSWIPAGSVTGTSSRGHGATPRSDDLGDVHSPVPGAEAAAGPSPRPPRLPATHVASVAPVTAVCPGGALPRVFLFHSLQFLFKIRTYVTNKFTNTRPYPVTVSRCLVVRAPSQTHADRAPL